jgi:hypothetical protein
MGLPEQLRMSARLLIALLVTVSGAASCRWHDEYEDCDNLGYQARDSFRVTVVAPIDVDLVDPERSCPEPQLGDSFGVGVGERVEYKNSCYLPLISSAVPGFLQGLVERCHSATANFAMICEGDEGSAVLKVTGARAGETSSGTLTFGWHAPDLVCRITADVEIEGL